MASLASIIIPVFNAQKYLKERIDSCLAQTYQDYEIIVIDDGSTDGTPELIRSYGNSITSRRTTNRGPSAVRNLGTSIARGEYAQYLDADDILLPIALELRVNAMINTNADVVYSYWQDLEPLVGGGFCEGRIHSSKIEDVCGPGNLFVY